MLQLQYVVFRLFPVHVRVAESAHERVRADHLLHSHPHRELGVAVTKLVDVDADDARIVVKLDEPLNDTNDISAVGSA